MPQSGTYIEGVEYTRSGGTYTFAAAAVGAVVEIQYQTQDSGATWQSALAEIGLDLALGAYAQPVWSHLSTNHPSEAIGYSGIAYVYAASYRLNDSAQVENHNFEVSTPSEFSSTIPDADMSLVVRQFLTDGQRGVQWPAAYLADLTDYHNYVVSHGLFMSPVLTEQAAAADVLARWLQLTNSDAVMSGSVLKIVPLGDESKTGNGATYTANTTPVYDLGPDDFLNEGRPRVRQIPRANEDRYNVVRVEYRNRANAYNVDIAEARDRAHIDEYGERVMEVIQAHEITTAAVAGFAAQMELQRQMAVANDYEFSLPWTKGRLEPLDLVTLTTEDELGLVRVPVRISTITESDDGQFDVTAEDAPIGMASAPLFGVQAGSGYQADYNVAPGNVDPPAIFEGPAPLAGNSGVEVYAAARGSGGTWGGCTVWCSLDGASYRQIGTIYGGARYGTVASAVAGGAATLPVNGLAGKQLLSGSAADASQLATLCFVGGANPEYLAYTSATLTGPSAYTLGGLVHAAYGTPANAHAAGDLFVRVDDAVARSGELERAYIGKTIHLKFCSFNVYGGGLQDLSEVTDYPYTITGAMSAYSPSAAVNFNSRNDRNGAAVVAPTIATDGSAVDHVVKPDGSADVSFEWLWSGTEADIDGFEILLYASTSASAYTLGSSPADEQVVQVPANKRAMLAYGLNASSYLTWAVRAYRVVDPDVNAAGILRSAWVRPSRSDENPYRPASNVAFAGDLTGTIAGIAASTASTWNTVAANFNSRNDRNGAAVVAPTIATDGSAVDHVVKPNGSADVSFEWLWSGTEADIDGFEILLYASTSASAYTLGSSPADEQVVQVPANKRAMLAYGLNASSYLTWAVRAYRVVDPDVNAAGILRSAWVKPSRSDENPYRPASNVAFAGDVTGTVNGIPAANVNVWSAISGINVTTGQIAAGAATAVYTATYVAGPVTRTNIA